MRFPVLRSLALLAALTSPGCARNYVARGAALYEDGYYIEAAEVFERTEKRLETASPDERARYGLYRGVTFRALGDLRSAERWLAFSESTLRNEEAELSTRDQRLLGYSLRELARQAAEAPSPVIPVEEPALATRRNKLIP